MPIYLSRCLGAAQRVPYLCSLKSQRNCDIFLVLRRITLQLHAKYEQIGMLHNNTIAILQNKLATKYQHAEEEEESQTFCGIVENFFFVQTPALLYTIYNLRKKRTNISLKTHPHL